MPNKCFFEVLLNWGITVFGTKKKLVSNSGVAVREGGTAGSGCVIYQKTRDRNWNKLERKSKHD